MFKRFKQRKIFLNMFGKPRWGRLRAVPYDTHLFVGVGKYTVSIYTVREKHAN